MKKYVEEDWEFEITVVQAGKCRAGCEVGDTFRCGYGCPGGFCPLTMPFLYTLCEIVRCGGNYAHLGSREPYAFDFNCVEHVARFHLQAIKIPETAE